MMTKLSVNINKIATLRNARGGNVPDLLQCARDIEKFGAQGITIHPRPDERHITKNDVYALKNVVKTELNIEGYPSEDFLRLIEEIKPAQATLVPDPPNVLTSNAGWNTIQHQGMLKEIVARIHESKVRTSLFIAPDEKLIEHAAATGTQRIELYTEAFAAHYKSNREKAVQPYSIASKKAHECGLGINAGHDLSLENLKFFKDNIEHLEEVSIGHALISDAIYYGLQNVVQMYLKQLR